MTYSKAVFTFKVWYNNFVNNVTQLQHSNLSYVLNSSQRIRYNILKCNKHTLKMIIWIYNDSKDNHFINPTHLTQKFFYPISFKKKKKKKIFTKLKNIVSNCIITTTRI
jgi:hypothetical protein